MPDYKEDDICISGSPIVTPIFCPPILKPIRPVDLDLRLQMGVYTYDGSLTTDLPAVAQRLSDLTVSLWRRLNFFIHSLSTTYTHTFKYPTLEPKAEPKPDKTITGSAFTYQNLFMAEIDSKLDSIVADLADVRAVASIVESWQIRPESNREQAAFLFGEWEPGMLRIGSPKWQIVIPHFRPAAIKSYSNNFGYIKGSHQFLYTLPDNSKIIFYGNNPVEMQGILDRWLGDIPENKRVGGFLKTGMIKGLPFSVKRLRLVRIDYYANGILHSAPTAYFSYSRVPLELRP